MAAAIHHYLKDENYDPGVNLDSCGEDSDTDVQNNHKSSWSNEHHGQDLSDTLFVQNNLACKCTGTKCICADASTDCDTIGGPQSATGYHTCEGGNLQEKHKDKCKGERAKGLYPKDGGSTEDIWECGINHQNLCKYCFNYSRCPVCGPQVRRISGM